MELLQVYEDEPANWPEIPDAPIETETAAVWRRIEHWIAYRWHERTVTWFVSGAGDWTPPLQPYTVDSAEQWTGTGYSPVTLANGPLGLWLEGGQYKIQASVGDLEEPPDDVLEACRRLAQYYADNDTDAGLTSVTDGDYSVQRGANAMGRAMQYSGAADLLRRYR